MHQIIAIAANPGIYVESASALETGLWIAFISAAVLLAIPTFFYDKACRRGKLAISINSLVFAAVFLATAFALAVVASNPNPATVAHAETVTSWLDSDYGVTADAETTQRLLDGETLVMNLDGDRQAMSLVESSSGDLKVVDRAGDVIEPLNGRN